MLSSAAEAQLASAWSRDGRRDGGEACGTRIFTTSSRTKSQKSQPYGPWSVFLRKAQLKLSRYAPHCFSLSSIRYAAERGGAPRARRMRSWQALRERTGVAAAHDTTIGFERS